MNQPIAPTAQPFVGHTFRIQYGPAMTGLSAYVEDGSTMCYEVTSAGYASESIYHRVEPRRRVAKRHGLTMKRCSSNKRLANRHRTPIPLWKFEP